MAETEEVVDAGIPPPGGNPGGGSGSPSARACMDNPAVNRKKNRHKVRQIYRFFK
ncbi:hypothetical protein [Pelosinus propionicus]|uniref:hypothetical protein n=1 Tax=Pelosinus propionicus TaxID=380084 RepID=UPI001587D523|nr:hypothetical protein [Pelosinus propionicus]